MSRDEDAVLLQVEGPLATITLNRPAVLNAMNLAWVQGLEAAVERVAAEPEVRVVVVGGAGGSFCAGLDLDMLGQERMPPGFYEGQERAFRGLELMDKITIAALHGHCLGGGLQLAISCDIRICSRDCLLGLPAIREGLVPGMAPVRLPRLIGLGPARRLILSGENIAPDEALWLGLVDHVVPAERFDAERERLVDLYLQAPRMASVGSKRLMARVFEASWEDLYLESVPLLRASLDSPEVAKAAEAWRLRRVTRRGGKATE